MAKKDHFVALTECHLLNEAAIGEMMYYPQFQRWWESVDGVLRVWAGRTLGGDTEIPHPCASEPLADGPTRG